VTRPAAIAGASVAVVLAVATGSASTLGAAAGRTAAAPAVLELAAASHVAAWTPESDNRRGVPGRLLLGGRPVSGATLLIDGVPTGPTGAGGRFSGAVDATVPGRHLVTVSDVARATVAGTTLSAASRADLLRLHGAVDVAYAIAGLQVRRTPGGIAVSGRVVRSDGVPAPAVRIFSYRLSGRIIDASGKPVAGAIVSTRTQDRDYWTVSEPTDADGRYVSLFTASDDRDSNPVPFSIRVAVGDHLYEFLPDENVYFRRLQSAVMNLRLPPAGFAMALPLTQSHKGAVFQGVLLGASRDGRAVVPVRATWPDARGRFELVLPASLSGATVSLFEAQRPVFSSFRAVAGGPIDLAAWPAAVDPTWADGVVRLRLP
jgi:hypothetical protein